MPRMTPELLLQPSYLNPLKDRELDLRGHKIPALENLGVTKDSLDSLDLTDNAIRSLSNIPRLPRLKHLLLANNPVSTVSPSLLTSLPNLTSLVLTGSALDYLSPTIPLLGRLPRLEFLSLAGSPMSKRAYYREWVVHHCKRVRILDFSKVKVAEREKALSLFVDSRTAAPTSLAQTLLQPDPSSTVVSAGEAATFVPGEVTSADPSSGGARKLTPEERQRIRKAIEDAETVDEVRRLQRMLEQGFVPKIKDSGVGLGGTPASSQPQEPVAEAEAGEDGLQKGKKTAKTAGATRAKSGTKATNKSTKATRASKKDDRMEVEEELE